MRRIWHALLSAGPNHTRTRDAGTHQESRTGSDIGVGAIPKGENQVDRWEMGPLAAPGVLGTPVHGGPLLASAPEAMEAFQSVGRGMGLQEPAGTCRDRSSSRNQQKNVGGRCFPHCCAAAPRREGPSMSPSCVNSNRDAKPTPEARRPGSRRRPVASGMFHGASVPRLILARTSRLSRWSRKGAAMEPLCGPLCHPRRWLLGVPHVIV